MLEKSVELLVFLEWLLPFEAEEFFLVTLGTLASEVLTLTT